MKKNIIFVLLDGARFDRLEISKEFMQLAKKGMLCDNVTTAIPYTFGSINVIFTGLFGKENGVDAYYKMFRLKKSVEFLPELLQNNGYFTACKLISDKVVSSRGFDTHEAYDEYSIDPNIDHPKFIRQIFQKCNNKPVFMFLQYSKIHTVTVSEVLKKYEWNDKTFYENKEDNLQKYDDSFIAAGKYAKTIYDTIDELQKTDETIIIFFADHGTGIGERYGERNYGSFLFEETLRTFYLFIGKDIKPNKTKSELLSTIDIFPTILDISQIQSNQKIDGKSILDGLKNDKIETRDYTFAETGALHGPYPSPKEPNVFGIKSITHKLIYYKTPNKWELFDLTNDPNENNNIYGKNLSEESILKEKLIEWINR